jgi:hypothetical protein
MIDFKDHFIKELTSRISQERQNLSRKSANTYAEYVGTCEKILAYEDVVHIFESVFDKFFSKIDEDLDFETT